jgi:hypothetical protein
MQGQINCHQQQKHSHQKTAMIPKEISRVLALVTTIAIALNLITPQSADAGWWEDLVSPNIERARSETVGRAFQQIHVAQLSSSKLDRLKAAEGGDWSAKVTDWCDKKVAERSNFSVRHMISTWRVEGGKVNCYHRLLWYK